MTKIATVLVCASPTIKSCQCVRKSTPSSSKYYTENFNRGALLALWSFGSLHGQLHVSSKAFISQRSSVALVSALCGQRHAAGRKGTQHWPVGVVTLSSLTPSIHAHSPGPPSAASPLPGQILSEYRSAGINT